MFKERFSLLSDYSFWTVNAEIEIWEILKAGYGYPVLGWNTAIAKFNIDQQFVIHGPQAKWESDSQPASRSLGSDSCDLSVPS